MLNNDDIQEAVDVASTAETMRPAVLPDDSRLLYVVLAVGLAVSMAGLAINNYVVVVLPLIVLAVFPGLPIFFHLLYHLLVKIEVDADMITVTDHAGAPFVRLASSQQISFDEICYVYYLEKEINLLKNLRGRLRKFKISPKETDYTRQNLTARYRVSEETIRRFEQSSQKALTDHTATGVLMELDEICSKGDEQNNQERSEGRQELQLRICQRAAKEIPDQPGRYAKP